MVDPTTIEPRLREARLKLIEAQRQFNDLLRVAQKECDHASVGETPYLGEDVSSASRPMRVCLCCGLSEEGWGVGYHVLARGVSDGQLPQLSRDAFYRQCQGLFVGDEQKDRDFLRGVVTLPQLIDMYFDRLAGTP